MKHKISITTEPIEVSILGNLQNGSVVVLGYFIFVFMSWDCIRLFFLNPLIPFNTEYLNATGAAANEIVKLYLFYER